LANGRTIFHEGAEMMGQAGLYEMPGRVAYLPCAKNRP
jgi:hypothetical protein